MSKKKQRKSFLSKKEFAEMQDAKRKLLEIKKMLHEAKVKAEKIADGEEVPGDCSSEAIIFKKD